MTPLPPLLVSSLKGVWQRKQLSRGVPSGHSRRGMTSPTSSCADRMGVQ